MAKSNKKEELGFEEVLGRLKTVVETLETGNLGLEDSLKYYEEGVALARNGHGMLESAEKRVALLVGNEEKPLDAPETVSE